MSHTWVRHRDTGGYWLCPDEALDEMADVGWEPTEAPAEPNPAVDERLAWEAEQKALRDAEAAAAPAAETTKSTKAARRGEISEE